ncbi:MAG: hypothetical protein HKN84_07710 [Gammaproteobacteria bacterium]|nr:hypothetical protein [Gammaproteobacteria bacterium]
MMTQYSTRKLMMILTAILTTFGLSLTSAHHSHNAYEITVWSELEGTVSDVLIMFPHSWMYLDVTDANGEVTTWAIEAASPPQIYENGVKPEDVQPGDRVKVRIHLLRDGTNGGLLGFVTPLHGDPARGHGVEMHWD